jgi:thymidylate synthase
LSGQRQDKARSQEDETTTRSVWFKSIASKTNWEWQKRTKSKSTPKSKKKKEQYDKGIPKNLKKGMCVTNYCRICLACCVFLPSAKRLYNRIRACPTEFGTVVFSYPASLPPTCQMLRHNFVFFKFSGLNLTDA